MTAGDLGFSPCGVKQMGFAEARILAQRVNAARLKTCPDTNPVLKKYKQDIEVGMKFEPTTPIVNAGPACSLLLGENGGLAHLLRNQTEAVPSPSASLRAGSLRFSKGGRSGT